MLVQQNVCRLQVSVDDVGLQSYKNFSLKSSRLKAFKFTENDFGGVKLHFWFVENTVLGQVVVQVAAVHQVQNEAEFVGRVECVRHAHYERTVHLLRTKHIL
jgi:hypothetical protein